MVYRTVTDYFILMDDTIGFTFSVCLIAIIPLLIDVDVDDLVHDCSNSIASALELLQPCTNPSI